jgi:hypothetical protein
MKGSAARAHRRPQLAGRYVASLGALFGSLLGACGGTEVTTPVAVVTLPESSAKRPLPSEGPLLGCAEVLAALAPSESGDRPELPDDLVKKRDELRKVRVSPALQPDVQAYDSAVSDLPILSGPDSFAEKTVELLTQCHGPECFEVMLLVGGHTMHQDLRKTLPLLTDELDKRTFNDAELAVRVRAYSITIRDHVRRMESLDVNLQSARSAETRLVQVCRASSR